MSLQQALSDDDDIFDSVKDIKPKEAYRLRAFTMSTDVFFSAAQS